MRFPCQVQPQVMCPDNLNILCWLYTLVRRIFSDFFWFLSKRLKSCITICFTPWFSFDGNCMVIILIPWKCFFTLVDIAFEVNIILCNNGKCFKVNLVSSKYTFKIVLFEHIQTDIIADWETPIIWNG